MVPVVVTGAAGFIGRHLVERLAADGHDVVGIDRRPDMPAAASDRLVADLADDDPLVDAALESAAAVFHLAATPGVRDTTSSNGTRRWRDNVLAAARVLAVVPRDVPLVVASSSSVYGGAGDPRRPRPCPESAPLRPVGGYARSKAALEVLCARRAAAGGHVAVVRPFTVIGEGQRPDMAVARWLGAAAAGEPLPVFGGLDRVRDLTDVRDVVEGMVRVAARGVATTVNLGTGWARTLAEVVGAVGAATGTLPRVAVRPAHPEEVASSLADTSRCEALLGFRPTTDLQAVIARQAAGATHPVAAPAG